MTTARELRRRLEDLECVNAPGPGIVVIDKAVYEATKEELYKKNHPYTIYLIDDIPRVSV